MKQCSKCRVCKPETDFSKGKAFKDGFQPWCKVCIRNYRKENPVKNPWHRNNPEKNRARSAAWKQANVERVKIRDAEYRNKNKEKSKIYSAQYRAQHREQLLVATERWRLQNIIRVREKRKIWKDANKGRVLANVAFRKYRKRKATPPWLTSEQRQAIADFYISAHALGMLLGEWYHVDHVVPLNGLNFCGWHVPWNLQILPAEENISKSNKMLDLVELFK